MNEIIKALEIIGTIAFAISGALVAISASLDIFGIIFVSCVTAFGGGILRDILLGVNPPAVFDNAMFLLIAIVTAIVVFVVSYINKKNFDSIRHKIEHINNIFDAIGLAAFSIIHLGFDEFLTQQIGNGLFKDLL